MNERFKVGDYVNVKGRIEKIVYDNNGFIRDIAYTGNDDIYYYISFLDDLSFSCSWIHERNITKIDNDMKIKWYDKGKFL